ncbi:MAG: 50S ribosomal protein L3 [Deltaproteobacteria bacterium]|nr:50S ribosomal protein L3 [Deltaproteobacteria bacterium]
MVQGLMGIKLGMSRIFLGEGIAVPVTVLKIGPCKVVQKKEQDRDGYTALQLGFLPKKEKRTTKPLLGHFNAAGVEPMAHLKEFPVDDADGYDVGQELGVGLFAPGDFVHVTGKSKGRGFAGVIKRHGFSGGKATHGCKTHRSPGSVGCSAYPSRVMRGKRMPGHMGDQQTTIKNLLVLDVRPEQDLMIVRGAVPGSRNSLVTVRKAPAL